MSETMQLILFFYLTGVAVSFLHLIYPVLFEGVFKEADILEALVASTIFVFSSWTMWIIALIHHFTGWPEFITANKDGR